MTTMSPSDTITPGEIVKINELLAASLRKSGLPNAPTQEVIEQEGAQLTEPRR